MKNKTVFFGTLLSFALILSLFAVSGCASSSRVSKSEMTTTETTTQGSAAQGNKGNFSAGESSMQAQPAQTTVAETKTEVKEERSSSASSGVLGTTLHFIGQVLAFPFKIVAGIIEFIF